jgi:hypothetical protein
MSIVERYSYLWDGSQDGWVLLIASDLRSGFCIFNSLTSNLLHIDDEQLNDILCARMKAAGCRIIDSLPRVNTVVEVKPD